MKSSDKQKPLPEITDLTRPFWAAARDGKLMLQRCTRCGTMNFHPKPWCIECGNREIPWTEVEPTGTVYAFTTATTVMMNLPGWKDDLPLTLCLIDLDAGPRMYAPLVGCSADEARIGMRVRAEFERIGEDAGVPRFRPA